MSSQRYKFFSLSSSPSKMFDEIINEDNPLSKNQQLNPTETGWTPFIDKVFAQSQNQQPNPSYIAGSPLAQSKMTQSQFQQHQQLQQQLSLAPNLDSSPQKFASYYQQQQIQSLQSTVLANKVLQHQQPKSSSTSTPSTNFQQELFLRTPTAEKSFRLSDFIETTPNLNSELMNVLATGGDTTTEKENDPLLFDSFGTPSTQRMLNKYFKTPDLTTPKIKRYSQSRSSTGYTPSVLGTVNLNSFGPLSEESLTSIPTSNPPPTSNLSSNITSTIPRKHSANIYKTPLRTAQPQSSPSTIIAESAQKAEQSKASLELSPTPSNKLAQVKTNKPPCKLVKSNSSLEPAIGIFSDKAHSSRPLSNFSKALLSTSNGNNSNNTRSSNRTTNNNRFQIIFTDMKTLTSHYSSNSSKKSKKIGRSNTTILDGTSKITKNNNKQFRKNNNNNTKSNLTLSKATTAPTVTFNNTFQSSGGHLMNRGNSSSSSPLTNTTPLSHTPSHQHSQSQPQSQSSQRTMTSANESSVFQIVPVSRSFDGKGSGNSNAIPNTISDGSQQWNQQQQIHHHQQQRYQQCQGQQQNTQPQLNQQLKPRH